MINKLNKILFVSCNKFNGLLGPFFALQTGFSLDYIKKLYLQKIEKSHFLLNINEVLPFCVMIYVVLLNVFHNCTRNVVGLGEMRAVEIDFHQTSWKFFLRLVWKLRTRQVENCVTLCTNWSWITHYMCSPHTQLEVVSSFFGKKSVLKLNFLLKFHGFSQNLW